MIKKAKRFFGDLVEKIFKRMELHNIKLEASSLKDKIEGLDKTRQELTETVALLISGKSVDLTQNERRLIMNALTFPQFKEFIETPATKAIVRITWKSIKEKIALSIVEEVDIAEKKNR